MKQDIDADFCKSHLGVYYNYTLVYDIETDRVFGKHNGRLAPLNMGDSGRTASLKAKQVFDNNFGDIELVGVMIMQGGFSVCMTPGTWVPHRKLKRSFHPTKMHHNSLCDTLLNYIIRSKATGDLTLYSLTSWMYAYQRFCFQPISAVNLMYAADVIRNSPKVVWAGRSR